MCFERVFNVFIQAADAVMAYIEAIGDRDVCAYDLVTALRRLPPTALPPLLARVLASPGGAKVCMCTDIYRYLPMCAVSLIYISICTDMYRYVPICTDMYRCALSHSYTYMYVCTLAQVYIYIYVPNVFLMCS